MASRTVQVNYENAEGPRSRLDSVSRSLLASKRIVVISGAGLSTSSGIPDFRSSNGVYQEIYGKQGAGGIKGAELLHISALKNKDTVELFCKSIQALKSKSESAHPSLGHKLLELLGKKKRLLRIYTQNIDGLEQKAGLPETEVVKLHGDLQTLQCLFCLHKAEWSPSVSRILEAGSLPECPKCFSCEEDRSKLNLRPHSVGVLIPGLVLYGQHHPTGDCIATVQQKDIDRSPDFLLILGTSMMVVGLKDMVKRFALAVRGGAAEGHGIKVVFVNLEPPRREWEGIIDVHIQDTIDSWASYVLEYWIRASPASQTFVKVNGYNSPTLCSNHDS